MIDQTHGILREPAPEPGKGGMIGRDLIKGKPQELLEGDPVVDLGSQFRIGVDVKPLLEQEAFHEDQGRMQSSQRYEITWVIHRLCNFICAYCYYSESERKGKVTSSIGLSAKRISECFGKTNRTWKIHITGGEPFLYPDFVKLCTVISTNHFLSINTNFSTNNLKLFADSIDPGRIMIIRASLHILERERLSLYSEFIKNIIYFQKKGFNIQVDYVLYPPLISRVEDDLGDLEQLGVKKINIVSFKGNYKGKYYPGAYDFQEKEYIKERSIDPRQRTIVKEVTIKRFGYNCNAGVNFFVMDPNGNLGRCTTSKRILGNLFMDSFSLDESIKPCPFLKCDCYYEAIDCTTNEKAYIVSIINQVRRELPTYYFSKLKYYKLIRFLERRYPSIALKLKEF